MTDSNVAASFRTMASRVRPPSETEGSIRRSIEESGTSRHLPPLPHEFISFLIANDLDPQVYEGFLSASSSSSSAVPWRFVHPTPHPRHSSPLTPEEIVSSLSIPLTSLSPVPWLPSDTLPFYRIPGETRVAPSDLWRTGRLQALDASSAVAVHALSLSPDDHVLDLCCAPGGKLSLCAELLRGGRGTVTGVDISRDRTYLTLKLLSKLGQAGQNRVYIADGAMFDLGVGRLNIFWREKKFGLGQPAERALDLEVDARWAAWERDPLLPPPSGEEKTATSSPRPSRAKVAMVPQRFEKRPEEVGSVWVPYDKVLVDAECTHDGSISHILKYLVPSDPADPSSPQTYAFPPSFLTSLASSTTSLPGLQLGLLMNGFRLVRPGGIVVYSTCSRSRRQGEMVVQAFLDAVNGHGGSPRAVLEDVPGREWMPCEPRDEARLEGKGLRFSGVLEEGREEEWVSGLFVCRVRKIR